MAAVGAAPTTTANPIFDRLGMLALDPPTRDACRPSPATRYRMVVRDAYLLAGRQLPVDVDGRKQMALRHQGAQIPPRGAAGVAPTSSASCAELAHRTGATNRPARAASRPPTGRRGSRDRRQQDAQRARAEILAFKQQIANGRQ